MSILESFVIPKSGDRVTSESKIQTSDEEIMEALKKYLPDPFLNVGTKIIKEDDGIESLVFDVSLDDGWSQATFGVLSSLRFREMSDGRTLAARPNNPDGSLATIPKLLLHNAVLFLNDDVVTTAFQWMPQIKGKQTDYVYTCWTW